MASTVKPKRSIRSQRKALTQSASAALPMARYKVEAVSRAVLLLEALRRTPGPLSMATLATRTGLSPASVAAALATLQRRRLIDQPAAQPDHYVLGLGWLRLADVKRRQLEIREVALPVMRRMRDAVNETVSLGVRIGSSRANIEYAECHHEVRRIVQPGFHVALHVGAGGRALMSGLDDAEIEAYLATIPSSQIEKSKLLAGIKATRKDGFAVVEGEVTSDTSAVAAPIRNHVGDVVATVTFSMPEDRFSPQRRARCTREVVKGASEISRALGFDPGRAV